jgi:hypothetical protein
LQCIHRVIATFLIKQSGLERSHAHSGAVTLIQRFGSAANLNIHLHWQVADGVYGSSAGAPVFHEARAPSVAELEGLLNRIIRRIPDATDAHRLPHRRAGRALLGRSRVG